jgi:hypothetical protein
MNKSRLRKLLLLVLFVLGFGVRLYKIDGPLDDWHSWRQVDTAAVAQIYVDQGINLLYPRYYDISSIQTGYFNPQGLRFVEFPLYNVVHAVAYKMLPTIPFEIWGRLISILCSLVAGWAVYKISQKYIGQFAAFASLFFVLFLPFNIYYSRTILPEAMATMLAIVAVWQFALYADSKLKRFLYLGSISFSAALLVKPYTIFYGLVIAYIMIRKFGIRKLATTVPHYIALDIILIPIILWRGWIDHGNGGINFIGIPHLNWVFNGDGIRFRPAFWWWIFGDRLGSLILGIWGIAPFIQGLKSKGRKHLLPELAILSMFLFVSMVATANVRHDYYQTLAVPAIALVLGKGSQAMWRTRRNRLRSRFFLSMCVALMLLISAYRIKEYYKINHPELIEVGKIADQILPKDARVIAPDNSNTVFLYHTKRFGWPVLETNIDDAIKLGADYYISVNNDADTAKFRERFEAVGQDGTRWIILDLHKEKKK